MLERVNVFHKLVIRLQRLDCCMIFSIGYPDAILGELRS